MRATCAAWGIGITVLGLAPAARAGEAIVAVDGPRERFAAAPDAGTARDREAAIVTDRREERTTSSARLSLGGAAAVADRGGARGLAGLDLGIDLGSGVIGARLGAAWLRGAPGEAGLAHYGAEVTVDAAPRGPWHPIAALGAALAHTGGADAGVGTLRVGIAYALPVRDADVRVSLAVLGALPGPADGGAADLRAYAMGVGSLAVGF